MQRRMNGRSAPPASAALTQELHDIVESDRYPFSRRIRTMRAILAKLRPEPVREALPPPKVYAPPRAGRYRLRRG
jgi:hypothetical protein